MGLAVSGIALVYLLRRDFSGVRDQLLHARYWIVLPGFVLSGIGLWLRSLRWRGLLDNRLSPYHSFHILNVSYFINAVLPLRVGELVRAALAARVDPPVRVLTSLSTILVERLLDVLAVFVLLGVLLLALSTGIKIGMAGILLGVGAVMGLMLLSVFAARPAWAHGLLHGVGRVVPLFRRPVFGEWLDHLLEGIVPLASPRKTLLAVWWTALGWALSVIAGYVLLFVVFDDPTWAASIAMVALASFVVAVPAVPGNLGPFEAAVAFGLAATDLVSAATVAPAVAFALILHVVNLLVYVVLGLVGLWAEDVRLGEVTRAAQTLRRRQSDPA